MVGFRGCIKLFQRRELKGLVQLVRYILIRVLESSKAFPDPGSGAVNCDDKWSEHNVEVARQKCGADGEGQEWRDPAGVAAGLVTYAEKYRSPVPHSDCVGARG